MNNFIINTTVTTTSSSSSNNRHNNNNTSYNTTSSQQQQFQQLIQQQQEQHQRQQLLQSTSNKLLLRQQQQQQQCSEPSPNSTTTTTTPRTVARTTTTTPDTMNPTQTCSTTTTTTTTTAAFTRIGQFIILDRSHSNNNTYQALHSHTHREMIAKVSDLGTFPAMLAPYYRIGCHDNINPIVDVVVGKTNVYTFTPRCYGDLHTYVRSHQRLGEGEAGRFFRQIVRAVGHCHRNGLVLRDLKLRKFLFADTRRTQLCLESLDDAFILESSDGGSHDNNSGLGVNEDDDSIADKHGCPAYVSPEVLNMTLSSGSYSGRSADVWSLGVMLYTMLVGRYPFHETEPAILFSKIRRGSFSIPDFISSRAKCLIRALMRQEPSQRLTADEILLHPWFKMNAPTGSRARRRLGQGSHTVTGSNTTAGGSYRSDKSNRNNHILLDQLVPQLTPTTLTSTSNTPKPS